MFIVEPNTISVKKFAAFMYGNGVPVEKAIACFNACMDWDSCYVSCAMVDWYCTWDKNLHRAHKAEYYSMSLKRWIWINGKALNQHEAMWPEITVLQFGIESTGYEQSIKTSIKHVRSCTKMSQNFQAQ